MAMDSQQHSIRKSVVATAVIGVVFAASDTEKINWVINLEGWLAWLFLLIAHVYYSLMWIFWRRLIYLDDPTTGGGRRSPMAISEDTFLGGKVTGVKARMFIMRTLTDLVALGGFVLIALQFLWSVENAGRMAW